MKKFSFAKIVSLIFVCAMLMCAFTVIAFADNTQEAGTVVEIVSNNVYYGEKYQLMFAVNAPEGAELSATDSKGNALTVVPFAEDPNPTINGVACKAYIIKEGVAAQAIDEVVTLTVKYNEVTAKKSYSVLQYIYERTQGVSENQATGTELTMFNAFITFADAANAHFNGATGSFNDYVYVTVEGATVNGVNPTGMYAAGATPFANLELALDYDEANQILRWYADDVLTDLDAIKAIVVADKNIAVKAVVLDKCYDGHTMIAPTCQKAGYCDVCGAAGDPIVDHKDENGDYKCDYDCGTNVLPAADSVLTIEQAIAIGNLYTKDTYTTDMYYITGVIDSVYQTTYGNMYVKDANGNVITVYGTFDADGNQYGSMAEKPGAGDTVTLHGVIGYYTSAQMKNATITEYEIHEHDFSEATCTVAPTCSLCGLIDGESLGHIDENNDETCDRDGCDAYVAPEGTEGTLARFEFGANGSAAHVDGSSLGTSKTYTESGYSLTLTSMSSVYGPAFDAKGNSAIKLGTSSKAGSFSFTVDENVTKVTIYVAAYKAKTATVSVNGTATVLSTKSDNGVYTAIEIDTSVNKTIEFKVTSGYRCMIDAIEFFGIAK